MINSVQSDSPINSCNQKIKKRSHNRYSVSPHGTKGIEGGKSPQDSLTKFA